MKTCECCNNKGYIFIDYTSLNNHPTHNIERCDECMLFDNDEQALEVVLKDIELIELF